MSEFLIGTLIILALIAGLIVNPVATVVVFAICCLIKL